MDKSRKTDPLQNPSSLSDEAIVDLYFDRDENAIAASSAKYGRMCHTVADRILHDEQDAEECLSDTWIEAWHAIPPSRPARLGGFLAAITRHLALDRVDYRRAKCRDGVVEVSDEFWDCVPDNAAAFTDEIAFSDLVNRFLASLDSRTRIVFLQRYWHLCEIRDIARAHRMSENAVKVLLHRTRKRFKAYLEKEGISI